MLDIRSSDPISPYGFHRWWQFGSWLSIIPRLRYVMLVADWLHYLAQHSALDLIDEFDERRFWVHFENFKKRFPHRGWDIYRARFDKDFSKVD